MKQRNNAPHTPRVLLLGPTGSGKSVQAALLASKYQLVNGKTVLKYSKLQSYTVNKKCSIPYSILLIKKINI